MMLCGHGKAPDEVCEQCESEMHLSRICGCAECKQGERDRLLGAAVRQLSQGLKKNQLLAIEYVFGHNFSFTVGYVRNDDGFAMDVEGTTGVGLTQDEAIQSLLAKLAPKEGE